MTEISKYSQHYLNLNEEQMVRNIEQIDRKLEGYRLRVDLETIQPHVRGPEVLDFPIGTGRFYPNLMDRHQVWGYDICPLYVERARQLNPAIADHFREARFEEVPGDKQFDSVVSLRVMNNVGDLALAARNVASILKPGGRWIFNYPPSGSHHASMRELMGGAGLTCVHEERYDAHAALGDMGRPMAAFYTRFRRLIEAGLVPYPLYRLFDRVYGHNGTVLWVFEKAQ